MKDFFKSVALMWLSPFGIFMVSLTILLWSAGPKMLLHINYILVRAEGVETKVNASMINLDKATGTWANASTEQAQSLQTFTNKASGTLDQLNSEISSFRKTTDDLDTAVGGIRPLLDSTTEVADSLPTAVKSIQDTTAELKPTLQNSATLLASINTQINDPHVKALVANLDKMSASGDHMLSTADQVETKATKGYLHPSHNPFKRMWGAVAPFLVAGAKIVTSVL